MERNDSTLGSVMMVEWSTRKREMGDVGGNNVEDRSGYEKSGVRLAGLGWEDII
jgi:hypothetical protein